METVPLDVRPTSSGRPRRKGLQTTRSILMISPESGARNGIALSSAVPPMTAWGQPSTTREAGNGPAAVPLGNDQ